MNGLQFTDRTEDEDVEQGSPPEAALSVNPRQIVTDALLRSSGNPALMVAGNPQLAYDQVTNFRYGRYRDNTRSNITALGDVYDDADDEVFRITGQRLGNPLVADGIGDYFNREILNTSGTGTDRYASAVNDPRMQWHAELARLAASDPRLAAIQERYGDRARVDALAAQLRRDVTDDYHRYLGDDNSVNQLVRGVLGAPGMIVGGLSSGSPEQIAQLASGGAARGMTLAERAISGALSNIVGQAVIEPVLIEDARRMGEEYSGEQIALDFIIAAGFGAAIDVAGGVLDAPGDAPPIEMDTPPLRARVASLQENIRRLNDGGDSAPVTVEGQTLTVVDQAEIDRLADQIFRLRQGETLPDVTPNDVTEGRNSARDADNTGGVQLPPSRPMTLYHGSSSGPFGEFNNVPTFFARDRERSQRYAEAGGSDYVREVTANLRIANREDARPFFKNGRYNQEAMRAAGFDGFSVGEDVIIFRPREVFPLTPKALDDVPGGDIQRALTGQAESLVVSAYSRDAATARTFPDPDVADPIALADYINAADRFINGESDQFPVEARPVRVAEEGEVSAARAAADDTPAPDPGTVETIRFNGQERQRTFMRFDPREIEADAETFQYKRSQGADGLTGVLEGVETFDPASAGKVKVFEYADGRRVIADGHQRRALARSAAQAGQANVWLDGYLYREADGWTTREVRNLAAQKNLRETPGDPIDTAQLLREAPELIDSSVPQRSRGFRVAAGISKLSDAAFAAVRAGVVDPNFAAAIGEIAGSRPEIHEPLITMFQQQPPRSVREASFIVHEAMQAEVFRSEAAQLSMFGDAPELSGMRERAEILRIAGNTLRNDKRLFDVAARNADVLESAGNIIRKEESARRADLAEALLRNLDMLATRPSAVSRLLREIADTAAREKIKPEIASDRFVAGLVDLLNERGLIGLMQERPPEVNPPRPINDPPQQRMQEHERAADLANAHDADGEAFRQALAEIAIERAMRGDMADMPEPDAIGHVPEADMIRIEAALDALGIDDPTVPDVALAIYARPTPDMETEARARLRGDTTGDAPATHAEAVEQNAKIEIWNPLDFEDEAKLIAAIESATIPQLDKIQRMFPVGDGNARTRAEFLSQFTQEWRDTNGVQPPPPVVPVKRPAPSTSEVNEFIKRAARFVDREDAVQRYADARADLIDAIDRMGDKGKKWLERAIEDAPFGSRKKVLREVERARSGQFAIGDGASKRISDADPSSVGYAFDSFDAPWGVFQEAIEKLQRETNSLPVGVTEPIEAIRKIRSEELENISTLSDVVVAKKGEWRALLEEIINSDPDWFKDNWDEDLDAILSNFDDMFVGEDVSLALNELGENASMWYEDFHDLLNHIDSERDTPNESLEWPEVSEEIRDRAGALWSDLPDEGSKYRDPYSVVDEVVPLIAKLRRNMDELWDEWQSELGADVDASNQEALKTADAALADLMAAFDGGEGEEGLRAYSRPRNVRFASADAAPRAPKNSVANVMRQLQRDFPRYGKKLLERGRLTVVQSVSELPDSGRGFYARLFDAVKGPAERRPLADALESIRISEGEGLGFTDIYAWRSSTGRAMAAEIVAIDPRASAVVNFGILKPGGVQVIDAKVGEGLSSAIETLSMATAAIDRDAAQFSRPVYRFVGLTEKHRSLYSRMFDAIDPPAGYVKVRVVSKKGMSDGIAVIRSDIAEKNGFESGGGYNQQQLNALAPQTRTPRTAALADKQRALNDARFDLIENVESKLQSPPRRGAFARANGTVGYSEGGQSWLVADNLPPELVRGITLHEVGEHVGMPEMLGPEGYDRFLMDARKLYEAGDADIVSGYNIAVKRGTPESQVWSEAVAYALTYADPDQMSDGFRGFVMRVINSVRAWAWRTLPWTRNLDRALTFEDMQFLAMGALRHAANTEPRTIDVRSIPVRLRDMLRDKPRILAEAVTEAESGWLPLRVYHGKSGRPQAGMMFTTPHAKIAGLYGEIEAYEVRGPIYDASDDIVRTQDDFNRLVAEAQRDGANGVYIRALDRGKFGAQEQIIMFNGEAVRPAGSDRIDPNNPASVARAEAERLDQVVTMLEHCR